MVIVDELDLPFFDNADAAMAGDGYHEFLAAVGKAGWLAKSPVSYVVLDRDAGEFFLRARDTAFPGGELADLFGITGGRLREQIDANILNLRGDKHRRLRALVGPAFTPRAADRWRPTMREIAAELWAGPAEAGACDFATAFAGPFPARTIAAVLGAPAEDAAALAQWSSWVQRQFDLRALANEPDRIERAVGELYDYVAALLESRRGQPAHDLLTALLAAEEEGDRLSAGECVNLVLNVLAGGVDTTAAQLAHAIRLFVQHPDQWALLAERTEFVPRAVAEVLRFEPITPFTARICTADVTYRDVVFPAGTIVAICAERANREVDAGSGSGSGSGSASVSGSWSGEEFDIRADRGGERALTFGAGAHFCLGQNLARAELEEAIGFLAPRMRGLRAAGPERLGGVEGIYGVESLPIAWSV